MRMTGEDWIALIGKLIEAPEVQAALKEFEISANGPRMKSGYGDQPVPKAGVTIFFKTAPPRRTKQVTDIQFSREGLEGGSPYTGTLPHDVRWDETCAQLNQRLGPATHTAMVENQRWEFGDRYMTVDFTQDWSAIKKVQYGLSSPEMAASFGKI